MKKLATVFAAIALAGTPAFAADMAVKAPAPIAASGTINWAGFYIGADGGYGWGARNSPLTYTLTNTFGSTPGTSTSGLNAKGGFGGVDIGYNWQTGSFVYGVEADLQGANIRASSAGLFAPPFVSATDTANETLSWFATIRGRLGFAADRALFYITGGYAHGRVQATDFFSAPGPITALLTHNSARNGGTVGAGVEYYVAPKWTVRAEYQFIDLGTDSLSGNTGITQVTTTLKDKFSTIRFGVNYHLN